MAALLPISSDHIPFLKDPLPVPLLGLTISRLEKVLGYLEFHENALYQRVSKAWLNMPFPSCIELPSHSCSDENLAKYASRRKFQNLTQLSILSSTVSAGASLHDFGDRLTFSAEGVRMVLASTPYLQSLKLHLYRPDAIINMRELDVPSLTYLRVISALPLSCSDEDVAALINRSSRLKFMQLNLTSSLTSALFERIRSQSLRVLRLPYIKFREVNYSLFESNIPNLTELNLSNSLVSEREIASCGLLPIRELCVSGSDRITSIAPLAIAFPHLRVLDVSHTSIADAGIAGVVLNSLETLSIAKGRLASSTFQGFARNFRALRALNVSCCVDVDDAALRSFRFSALTSFSVNACAKITNEGLKALCSVSPFLEVLDLGHTAITTLPRDRTLGRLRVLDLAYCNGITDLSLAAINRFSPVLEVLSLSHLEKITTVAMLDLPHLRSLNLGGCRLLGSSCNDRRDGWPSVLSSRSRRLEELTLTYIGTVISIASLRFPLLRTLDLIEVKGDLDFSALSRCCPRIRSLSLIWTQVPDIRLSSLALPLLASIDLGGNRLVSINGLRALALANPKLRYVTITNCLLHKKLVREEIEELAARRLFIHDRWLPSEAIDD